MVESTPQHGDREQGEESEGEAPAGAATEEAGAQALCGWGESQAGSLIKDFGLNAQLRKYF